MDATATQSTADATGSSEQGTQGLFHKLKSENTFIWAQVAERCLHSAADLSGLLLLTSARGDIPGLRQLVRCPCVEHPVCGLLACGHSSSLGREAVSPSLPLLFPPAAAARATTHAC